jgi:hypothetical protein
VPDGDHVGRSSTAGSSVSCVAPLPSAFITKMSQIATPPSGNFVTTLSAVVTSSPG